MKSCFKVEQVTKYTNICSKCNDFFKHVVIFLSATREGRHGAAATLSVELQHSIFCVQRSHGSIPRE